MKSCSFLCVLHVLRQHAKTPSLWLKAIDLHFIVVSGVRLVSIL